MNIDKNMVAVSPSQWVASNVNITIAQLIESHTASAKPHIQRQKIDWLQNIFNSHPVLFS